MMSVMFTKSWETEEQLDEIMEARRQGEIIKGLVRRVYTLIPPKNENVSNDTEDVQQEEEEMAEAANEKDTYEVVMIDLPFCTAYCKESDFSEHTFSSLGGFAGTFQNVKILQVDFENEIVWVSVKAAKQEQSEQFWERLIAREKEGTLSDDVYTGVVTGIDPRANRVYVEIEGVECFITNLDWEYRRIFNMEDVVQRGEEVQLKIIRIDHERRLIQASRKATMPDPFKELEGLDRETASLVGRVTNVDPVHGIFIRLDNGAEVKGQCPRQIPRPVVNDIVSVRILNINAEEQRGRVVITGYPQGKKRIRDVGAFLYS